MILTEVTITICNSNEQMAIIKMPDGESLPESVSCEICSKAITLRMATVGMRAIDGKQTFACNGHFWDGGKLIRGWADFVFNQWRSQNKEVHASYLSDAGLMYE